MIVYKHTRFHRLAHIVREHTLAFATAPRLNDPFESSIELTSVARRPLPPPVYRPMSLGKGLAFSNPMYERDLERSGYWEVHDHNGNLGRMNEALQMFKKHVGVLSLTDTPLSTLMWSHYSDNHRGVCIGFDATHSFFNSRSYQFKEPLWDFPNIPLVFKNDDLFALGRVRYKRRRPGLWLHSHSDYLRRAFFTKHVAWSYEREYRLLRPLAAAPSSENGVAVFPFPPELLRVVIFGLNASKENIAEAMTWLEELPHVEIQQVRQKAESYELKLTVVRAASSQRAG